MYQATLTKRWTVIFLIVILLIFPLIGTSCSKPEEVTEPDEVPTYTTDQMLGKMLPNSVNEVVSDKSQMDTMITDVKLYFKNGDARLTFRFNNETIVIEGYLLEAKYTRKDGQHYVLSPVDFTHPVYRFFTVGFTTLAYEEDLIPANPELVDKTVLSVMLKDRTTNDWYYWQGEMQKSESDKAGEMMTLREAEALGLRDTAFSVAEYQMLVENANENYWMDKGEGKTTFTTSYAPR